MTTSLKCQGCGEEIPLSEADTTGGNVGALMRASGCEPIIRIDTSMGWLCPACTAQAIPLIATLMELLGDERDCKGARSDRARTYWNCLPHIIQRQKAAAEAARGKTTP